MRVGRSGYYVMNSIHILSWRGTNGPDIIPANRVNVQSISAEGNTAQMAKGLRSSFQQLEKLGQGTYGTVRSSKPVTPRTS